MKFEINFERRYMLYLVVLTTMVTGIGLGVAYNSGGSGLFNPDPAGPMIMGHSPDEIYCDGCITDDNIATGANINGSKIEDGTITAEKLSSGAGSGLTEPEVKGIVAEVVGAMLVTEGSYKITNSVFNDKTIGDGWCAAEYGEGWRWCTPSLYDKYVKSQIPETGCYALKNVVSDNINCYQGRRSGSTSWDGASYSTKAGCDWTLASFWDDCDSDSRSDRCSCDSTNAWCDNSGPVCPPLFGCTSTNDYGSSCFGTVWYDKWCRCSIDFDVRVLCCPAAVN